MYTRYFLLKLELPYPAKHVWNAIIFTLAVLFIAKYVYTRYEQINFTKLELSRIRINFINNSYVSNTGIQTQLIW